ncbi:MAG: SDR family NAD(P)-dependent oxidoreductase, partial [Actinomycetota bacterium]
MSEQDWTAADIPDQTGRIAVITGANSGLGLETARELARRGAHVVLAVRNLEKGKSAIDDVAGTAPSGSLELLELDLASLDSVRTTAAELHDRHDHIDLLVNNAGVMYTPRQSTADG